MKISIQFETRFHSDKDTFLDLAKMQQDGQVLQFDYSKQSKIEKQSANDNP